MSTPDEYSAALKEFRRVSDVFHKAGAPQAGELADRYNAAAARLKEAASHRCDSDEPTRFDAP
ncbi:hypothetical protein ACFQZZ_22045 [Nocardia sp. GCM10030253]|uniref:hypothetical protein n=1 Tax=Nocardia sp. GCM10030253 TaxID=3273404 RepID=UPI00362E35D6